MAEKSGPSSKPENDVKAPNLFERAKEGFEAIVHHEKNKRHNHHHHHNETHGLRDDIDVNTPTSDVRAPNVFERAKEEIEAIVEAIHQPKTPDSPSNGESRTKDCSKSEGHSEKNLQQPVAKEGLKPLKLPHHRHHKETHGRSDDIDENTPIGEVKGPNVFERAKEEIEALIETIHPHKRRKD